MYDPKPSTEIVTDSVNLVSVDDVKDYMGNNRENKIDDKVLSDLIGSARVAIEDYLHRSIYIRDYKTTSTYDQFVLVHSVQGTPEINAVVIVDGEEVTLSANDGDFDAEFNSLDDVVTIVTELDDVVYYTATYQSGYIDIPAPILTALKKYVKTAYKRTSENPMLDVSASIKTFRKKRQNDYR